MYLEHKCMAVHPPIYKYSLIKPWPSAYITSYLIAHPGQVPSVRCSNLF